MTDCEIPPAVEDILITAARSGGRVVALTGAGISAESGIPTFRGPEGYWRVGSVNYRPEELATFAAFKPQVPPPTMVTRPGNTPGTPPSKSPRPPACLARK